MKKTIIEPHKSSLGMDANIASLVIFIAMAVVGWFRYLGWFAWAVPLVFFFLEKDSKFVKFQAVTALVIGAIQSAITFIFWLLTPKSVYAAVRFLYGGGWAIWSTLSVIVNIAISLLILYLIVMAYGYKQVELPVIGPIAAKISDKLDNNKQ